jgi:hypothetical protein
VLTADVCRVLQDGAGTFDEGYALLKPQYSGTYTIAVTVTDGCNWVQKMITVQATVQCCPHHAVAAGGNTIEWNNGDATRTMTSTVNPLSSTQATCLPVDYVSGCVR